MSKSDFLSWDCDIDLDVLLGEYTDDNPDHASPRKEPKKDNPPDGYRCPDCSRVLKTISGFRGHVSRLHDKPHLKAHQHRVKKTASDDTPIHQDSPRDIHHTLPSFFKSAFDSSLSNVASDPVHQLFGESEVTAISHVVMCLSGIHQFFLDTFLAIFSAGTDLCSTLDRERLFQRFHQTRLSATFIHGYMHLLGTLTFSNRGICDFVNIFMMELVANVLKEQVLCELKISVREHKKLSDGDQSILFYICGFLARSLRKRYTRAKNVCLLKRECLEKVILTTSSSTFVEKYSKWLCKNDRGGLINPCDDFFLLIREFETVIRRLVDIDNLSSSSLLCDQLKEAILESFMVKHYSEKLFGEFDDTIQVSVLEDILSAFLTVRGYAITRVQRNKLTLKVPKKRSSGLRQTLKDFTTMDNL